ncbi:hypothetical protein KSX_32720 [Ktedonospora formicarum]|uniref:DUF4352 domain-containing protein n=2 Tax=Ktedonospora formicarum TaxID=2778364 RepID=A0A8J3I470_9CHLR|nr:hypothetical protein KSX_32720 [Ktedonospora formicarum]
MQAPTPSDVPYTPPPATSDPYNSGVGYNPYSGPGAPLPPTNYGANPYGASMPGYAPTPGSYGYAPPKKKTSPWLVVGLVILVVVLLLCGGGFWGFSKLLGVGSSDGQANLNPKGINFKYSGVNMTVTSLAQAKTFDDDSYIYESSTGSTRYVRVNLHEAYPESNGRRVYYFVSYTSGFKLMTADNKSIKPLQEKYYTSGSAGQSRENWLDFKVDKAVEDLSQLVLKVGNEGTGEMVMSIPLKDNPDLSKYNDKAITPNKAFSYAGMSWTLKNASQSYSFAGKQAQDGQVFVTISLVANNPTENSYYMSDFVLLIGPDNSKVDPDLYSDLSQFYVIEPHDTNVEGFAMYQIKASPTGQYGLYFLPGRNNAWPAQTLTLQF